jgi:hypothetical protein
MELGQLLRVLPRYCLLELAAVAVEQEVQMVALKVIGEEVEAVEEELFKSPLMLP